MRRTPVLGVLVALAAAVPSGCESGPADKAGGSHAPVVLRLAASDGPEQPESAAARYFADRVARRSHGSLRVELTFSAAGQQEPDVEARVAQLVRDGRFELGWIGSRAWDQLGVKSFQALQAPFLITDQSLLGQVAAGGLATRMLGGLEAQDVHGLALVPGLLRHPVGLKRPFIALEDFAGARVSVIPSQATDSLMHALGATPVHIASAASGAAAQKGQVDAEERNLLNAPGHAWVTVDVTFFGKAVTLFAGSRALADLSGTQRAVLRDAAAETVRHVIASEPSETAEVRAACSSGRPVATAGATRRAALERAAQPVYSELGHDAETRDLIGAIRRLKEQTPAAPAALVPESCSAAPRASGTPRDPRLLDGTYRWRFTDKGRPMVGMATLRGGRWLFGGGAGDQGTYSIVGHRIVFDWPRVQSTLTFTFTRRADGTLDLTPVPPMDRGDQLVWASSPWRLVGPPVRRVP
jgi:TRAP-type C4-dicarboxylate transport system substrate-binding protein